jgi:hypothetical protein
MHEFYFPDGLLSDLETMKDGDLQQVGEQSEYNRADQSAEHGEKRQRRHQDAAERQS